MSSFSPGLPSSFHPIVLLADPRHMAAPARPLAARSRVSGSEDRMVKVALGRAEETDIHIAARAVIAQARRQLGSA